MIPDQRRQLAYAIVSAAVTVGYIGVLLYLMVPGVRGKVDLWRQWARWYRWKAQWEMLPPWLKEALIVRGRAPAEG